MDDNKTKKLFTDEEKIQLMEEVYKNFLKEVGEIRKRRDFKIKEIIKKIEEAQIAEIRKKLKE